MRHAFTLIELLVVVAIILVMCTCLLGPGGLEGIFALLAGWVLYPVRLARERDIDWYSVILCGVCLVGLTIGTHFFGRWFAASRPTPTTWPFSRTLKLVGLVMLMFSAGIVGIGITHEFVWLATNKEKLTEGSALRRAAVRTMSSNNLKQLAVASHHHEDQHKSLPAGGSFDATGRGMHGWQTALLPYIEEDALHKKIDLSVPWNDPKNAEPMSKIIQVYLHPMGDPQQVNGYGLSGYAGNIHVLGAKPMTLKDITDGPANTLLFGEVAHNLQPWGMPMNCRDPSVGLNAPHGFATPYGKVVVFAFADGSVRSIRNDISPEVLKALATPRGGEKLDQSELDR
jgi:prepilin-type N-terminal cleavage/methylation domain-containing protein